MAKIKDYPAGVTTSEKSPLFHLVDNPWMLLPHMLRQFTIADLVFKHTPKTLDLNVLDLGCGYAEQWILLRQREFMSKRKVLYTGVDLDVGKRDSVLEKYPKIDYRIHDITDMDSMPDPPADINVCIMSDSLEHVTRQDGIKILQDVFSLLDGIFILSVPSPARSAHRKNKHHLHEWESEDLLETSEAIGFQIVDNFQIHVPVYSWKHPEIKSRIPNPISSQPMGILSGKKGSCTIAVLGKGE